MMRDSVIFEDLHKNQIWEVIHNPNSSCWGGDGEHVLPG